MIITNHQTSITKKTPITKFGYWLLVIGYFKKNSLTLIHTQEGSLLLMSMLVLSGIASAAGTVSILTLQNLRQAVNVDQAGLAYYAAESGVEDSLYELRKKETSVAALLAPGFATGSLSNSATWTRSIVSASPTLTKTVARNDFWEVNLYNPDASLSALAAPIKSVRLAWTGAGPEWLEVEIAAWDTDGNILPSTTQLFSSASNPALVNLQNLTTVLYRLRLKALYGDLTDLTVTAFADLNGVGAPVDIPAQINITATGSFNDVKQALRATMPHRSPLSGVFEYVIFTEDDLIKP